MIAVDEIKQLIEEGHKSYLQHLSIDCVIFGYHNRQLKVLLLKMQSSGKWMLPGGFIRLNEQLEAAGKRILLERTGLDEIFLQQFHTFGDVTRSERSDSDVSVLERITGAVIKKDNWLLKRTISICYYALTEYSKVTPVPDHLSEECSWHDTGNIPVLAFDHSLIAQEALKALRLQIYHQPIGYNLLPEKFTLPEVHALYETILGKALDRRNFPKKLLSLGIITKLDEQKSIGAHRSPFLYKFNKRKYEKALKDGTALVI